jgi:tetratricopeptide (TPR) repeat protein
MGMIEIEREDYSKAIEYFKKGLPLLYEISGFRLGYADSLGRAYYMLGDLKKARDEYEKIDSFTTGRLGNGDIYAKSFYMLGKIHEKLGDTTKAIENYEKFLDLWKYADPGIAEVDDARKRLAGLQMPQVTASTFCVSTNQRLYSPLHAHIGAIFWPVTSYPYLTIGTRWFALKMCYIVPWSG